MPRHETIDVLLGCFELIGAHLTTEHEKEIVREERVCVGHDNGDEDCVIAIKRCSEGKFVES